MSTDDESEHNTSEPTAENTVDTDKLDVVDDYQAFTAGTAKGIASPDADEYTRDERINHIALGIAGEAGELAETIKKRNRDRDKPGFGDYEKNVQKEIGDVIWYLSRLADEMNCNLSDILEQNIHKLTTRVSEDTIHDEDNR